MFGEAVASLKCTDPGYNGSVVGVRSRKVGGCYAELVVVHDEQKFAKGIAVLSRHGVLCV